MILHNKVGARNYEDQRVINGQGPGFQPLHALLVDDLEQDQTMEQKQPQSDLPRTYVTIHLHCHSLQANELLRIL